jgi:putative transcriptional regulator
MMKTTTKPKAAKAPSRLRTELNELANAMHANGTLNDADHAKITVRDLARAEAVNLVSLSAADIRGLRDKTHLSQAAFAKLLNLTAGYVSKLERGEAQPKGPALKLLNVVYRKGIDAIL